jgi:hypothetical protein
VRWLLGRKYLMDGPVIRLTWEEKRFIEKRVVGRSNIINNNNFSYRKKTGDRF